METKIFRDSEYVRSYDEKGVAWTELLPGTFEPMKCYKCNLKAGSEVSPKRYGDKAVVFIFGKGTGYIAGTDGGFKINGVCFYAPDFDKAEYYIHALTDLEFVMCVAEMDDYDRERAAECHVYTPFFRTIEPVLSLRSELQNPRDMVPLRIVRRLWPAGQNYYGCMPRARTMGEPLKRDTGRFTSGITAWGIPTIS